MKNFINPAAILAALLLLVLPLKLPAQILSNLDTVRYSSGGYGATELLNDWSNTLGEFESIGIVSDEELKKEMDKQTRDNIKTVTLKDLQGKVLTLPYVQGDEGQNLFMLTRDGIMIYLYMDSPAYLPDGDEDAIIKWIRYYCHERRERTKKLFARFGSWEQWIREQMESRGVPAEIAELCMLESGCTTNAVSSAGAKGMWQFMPETGRKFGLIINEWTDDRLDPVKSTIAAAKLLAANYRKTNDWTLAVAAYNCGAGRIESASKKAYSREWDNMYKYLPTETRNYIPGLIALRYAWKYRKELALQ